jgi:hypothetical protein
MKKIIAIVTIVFAGYSSINAQIFKSKKDEVKVSFFSSTPIEDITAVHSTSTSVIIGDSIKFSMSNTGFVFPKPLMQEHFNENYMESSKYPKSTFRGKINEKVDLTKDGVYKVTCTGVMYMHGVEKVITVPGTITVKGGELNLVANFKAKLDDYKIARPKMVMDKIAEEIDVKIVANYAAYKKP